MCRHHSPPAQQFRNAIDARVPDASPRDRRQISSIRRGDGAPTWSLRPASTSKTRHRGTDPTRQIRPTGRSASACLTFQDLIEAELAKGSNAVGLATLGRPERLHRRIFENVKTLRPQASRRTDSRTLRGHRQTRRGGSSGGLRLRNHGPRSAHRQIPPHPRLRKSRAARPLQIRAAADFTEFYRSFETPESRGLFGRLSP